MDLARVPECIFSVITVSLVISIFVASSVQPKGVYLSPLPIGSGEVTYGAASAFAVLIVVTFLVTIAWMRAFKRKIDMTVSTLYVYLCSRAIDQYNVTCILMYIIAVFWTLAYYST